MRSGGSAGLDEEAQSAAVSFTVTQAGESRGTNLVQLRHAVERQCGGHALALTCALWVYNCTGLPLALQQSNWEQPPRADDEVSALLAAPFCRSLNPRLPRLLQLPLALFFCLLLQRALHPITACMQTSSSRLCPNPFRSLLWRACAGAGGRGAQAVGAALRGPPQAAAERPGRGGAQGRAQRRLLCGGRRALQRGLLRQPAGPGAGPARQQQPVAVRQDSPHAPLQRGCRLMLRMRAAQYNPLLAEKAYFLSSTRSGLRRPGSLSSGKTHEHQCVDCNLVHGCGAQAALRPGQGHPGGRAAGRGGEPGERALLHHTHQVPV